MIDEKKLKKDLLTWFSGKRAYCINHGFYDLLNDFEGFFDAIEDIIKAQPKLSLETKTSDKWIPCSERLPEENGRYIVTLFSRYNNRYESFDLWYEDGSWYECNYLIMDKIIAWMPLPEPYKGAE